MTAPLSFAGSAARGSDYTLAGTAASGVVYTNLNSGAASVKFTGPSAAVATVVLSAVTAGETVDIDLGSVTANTAVTAAGGVTSSDTAAALNIVEAPVVSLRLGSLSVAEDASSPVAVTARLDRAADAEVVVNVSAAGAAATLSDDKVFDDRRGPDVEHRDCDIDCRRRQC